MCRKKITLVTHSIDHRLLIDIRIMWGPRTYHFKKSLALMSVTKNKNLLSFLVSLFFSPLRLCRLGGKRDLLLNYQSIIYFSPHVLPWTHPSLLCLPFLLPSVFPSSPVSLLTLYKKTMFTSAPNPATLTSLKKQKIKSNGKTSRGPTTLKERTGEGWVCKSSPSSPTLCPPFFISIQSLYSTSLPVTLLCRCFLLHSTLHMCTQTVRIKTDTWLFHCDHSVQAEQHGSSCLDSSLVMRARKSHTDPAL